MADIDMDEWVEPVLPTKPKVVTPAFNTGNPLSQFFRKPGLSITLPSRGAFNSDIELTTNGELVIYPMVAADEILLKNPDALMNGSAIEQIIASCAPGVKNPRTLPTVDADAIFLAIKAATMGDRLEIEVTCPKCGEEGVNTISIRDAIGSAIPLEPEYTVRLEDNLIAYMRPHTYDSQTVLSLATFEEAKKLQRLEQANSNDEIKQFELSKSIKRMGELNVQLLAKCVSAIVVDGQEVTGFQHISEFMAKCPAHYVKSMEKCVADMNKAGVSKQHSTKCSNCNHEWVSEVVIDPSHFFD